MNFSPEFQFLANALSGAAAGAQAQALNGEIVDWEYFLALARRHRVSGATAKALLKALKRGDLTSPPPPRIIAALEDIGRIDTAAGLAMLGELKTILAALETRSIQPALLKGLDISNEAFGDIGGRRDRDIDLLIPADAISAAEEALGELGYKRTEPDSSLNDAELRSWRKTKKDFTYTHTSRKTIIELHWRLFDNPALMPYAQETGMEEVRLFDQVSVRALPRAMNFNYLCLHGSLHAWSRLKWLHDINALLAHLDADAVAARYIEAKGAPEGAAMGQALYLCQIIFGRPLPPLVERDIRKSLKIKLLTAAALATMTRCGAREIEDFRFGSTLKNLSHYALSTDLYYLGSELSYDFIEKFRPLLARKKRPQPVP